MPLIFLFAADMLPSWFFLPRASVSSTTTTTMPNQMKAKSAAGRFDKLQYSSEQAVIKNPLTGRWCGRSFPPVIFCRVMTTNAVAHCPTLQVQALNIHSTSLYIRTSRIPCSTTEFIFADADQTRPTSSHIIKLQVQVHIPVGRQISGNQATVINGHRQMASVIQVDLRCAI